MSTIATPSSLIVERAITLQQPWPWAIAKLGKRIENRGWKPDASILGQPIGIHGGRRPGGLAYKNAAKMAEELAERFNARDQLAKGWLLEGIIGVATIGEVVTESDDPWFTGPYGWRLTDVTIFEHPILCGGAQGAWKIPDREKRFVANMMAKAAMAATK